MNYRIFHNSRCRKSRAGLEYLQKSTQNIEVFEYLKEGLKESDIEMILDYSNLEIDQVIRTQEEAFKKLMKGKNLTKDQKIQLIVANPKLLQRPIVVNQDTKKAVLGQPESEISKIL